MSDGTRTTSPEARIASYFARYEPATAKLGKALRAKLRARLPGLSEVVYVYETRKALVISYSPTGKGYEGVCSLALDPDGVKLFFGQGARLSKADPKRLLQGRGTVRHVAIGAAADLGRAEIEALMAAALTLAKVRPEPGAKGDVAFRVEAQKQRARRAANAARSGSEGRKAKPRR